MAEHNEIGKKGENIAFNYLKDNSYEILHQNHRIGRAEFDFICRNIKKELIFVEVKTRFSEEDNPEIAISKHKENMLKDGASDFKEKNNLCEESFFEIIAINLLKNEKYKIFHIKDALY
jgi:putative endonuclease